MLPILLTLVLFCPPESSARGVIHRAAKELQKKALEAAEDARTTPPKDNEVCFSPDENCDEKLVKFIMSAKESIEIAIFDINREKIIDAIVKKFPHVKIRLIVNRKLSKDSAPAIERFRKEHIMYRVGKQAGIMHNKFVIVDGKRLMTGSFNFTNGAARKNQENQVYLSHPEILARYKERFQKMWLTGLTR